MRISGARRERGGIANARGHLLEEFVAKLLNLYGFEEPQRRNLNFTSDGIELDVSAKHDLTHQRAVVECKAYAKPVPAAALAAFFGKLTVERFEDTDMHGFFVALPRLTQPGAEKVTQILERDSKFTYLDSFAISKIVRDRGITGPPPTGIERLHSDEVIVITPHGVYEGWKVLDPFTRTASRVEVWANAGLVPEPVIELLAASEYAAELEVSDIRRVGDEVAPNVKERLEDEVVVEVQGSGSNFEYQLPAAPQYFVGRTHVLDSFESMSTEGAGVLVLNAQSGWGKSSLALRLKQSVIERGGVAIVIDSRTANSANFVAATLRKVALLAEKSGIIKLPDNASYASLASALGTIEAAEWLVSNAPIMLFFDQFENVFRNFDLTSAFRNLALSARELSKPVVVGFAWKTDLVGWTEDHPYQLRDEIRSAASVIQLPPLGAREVETLLRRLEAELNEKLSRELRQRLREYSQGLPWLLKKFAGHLLREAKSGVSQATLVEQSLNVRGLFDADLAELDISQSEALRAIARYAPVPAAEIMERVPAAVVQSLIDRRLIVQVGEQLDTYWDIFRDYLNTGRVPIQESYILRQGPRSVFRLLRSLNAAGGSASIADCATSLSMTEKAVANVSRELRLLGVASYNSGTIKLIEEVQNTADYEAAFRQRASAALRKHRGYSLLDKLATRNGGKITLASFARQFQGIFPAVEAAGNTWAHYAKVFAMWAEYAGLVTFDSEIIGLLDESHEIRRRGSSDEPRFADPTFPWVYPGPALSLLLRICSEDVVVRSLKTRERSNLRDLRVVGLVNIHPDGIARPVVADIIVDGEINIPIVERILRKYPGVATALDLIAKEPRVPPIDVGIAMREAVAQPWSDQTAISAGKKMRAWAKVLGLPVLAVART